MGGDRASWCLWNVELKLFGHTASMYLRQELQALSCGGFTTKRSEGAPGFLGRHSSLCRLAFPALPGDSTVAIAADR